MVPLNTTKQLKTLEVTLLDAIIIERNGMMNKTYIPYTSLHFISRRRNFSRSQFQLPVKIFRDNPKSFKLPHLPIVSGIGPA
jgi:hypothetical protein